MKISDSNFLFHQNTNWLNKSNHNNFFPFKADTSSSSNSGDYIPIINEINSNVKALISSYNDAKEEFNLQLNDRLDNLKENIGKIKNTNIQQISSANNADTSDTVNTVSTTSTINTSITSDTNTATSDTNTTTITNVDTNTSTESMSKAVNNIYNFINSYNDMHQLFTEYSNQSKRLTQMNIMWDDTKYQASNYQSIGIVVDTNGKLSINKDKLIKSINKTPEQVTNILSRLVKKAESHSQITLAQQDKLFPSQKELLGDQLNKASIYTGNAFIHMNTYMSTGNFLNMFI